MIVYKHCNQCQTIKIDDDTGQYKCMICNREFIPKLPYSATFTATTDDINKRIENEYKVGGPTLEDYKCEMCSQTIKTARKML